MDITTEQVIMAENERPQIRAQLTMCGAAVTLALPEGASLAESALHLKLCFPLIRMFSNLGHAFLTKVKISLDLAPKRGLLRDDYVDF
jgi:hypothetical protein